MPRKMTVAPAKPRLGRQTPTRSYILPYEATRGAEAVELYAETGRTAQEWQQLLLYDLMATNAEGLWVHTKFGYAVPRRNGKNEIVAMREMAALADGQKVLHTAHRTTTSHSAWERLCGLLDDAGREYTSVRATGRERIKCKDSGGVIEFRTRSTKGGLGEGFDLLIIDEAQEYTEDQESALKYVVSDSANPQTILCGTPPTPTSSGTVFMKMRAAALAGERTNTGWAEWSVDAQHDPQDRDAWYETNPSMGTILSERKVLDEIGPDVIDFNIQRLGLWLRYNQKSAISRAEWDALKAETLPTLINGSPCSLPLPFYASGFSFETALKANFDKGAGWCLATNAMYAAIALLCKASGFMPRGNNSFGKDYSKPFEKSIPVLGYDHDRIAKTLCGSGPVSWNHNNDATGICDLNGNAAEWAAGLRLVDGEINIIPDNNAALPTVDQGAESTLWKAIRADGTLVEPGTEGAIKLDLVSNHITFTTGEQTSPTVNNHYTAFSALGAGTGLTETIPQLLYSLALFPKAPGDKYTGSIYATWPGEMLALRGGPYFFNITAGVFCIMLSYPRTRRDGNFQNRSGYVGEL